MSKLYLACKLIDVGTCTIVTYNQQVDDELLALDDEDEFVVYLDSVGRIKRDYGLKSLFIYMKINYEF
ncbi:MAG: hypothetical protein ACTSWZ_05490 [Candidatus Heimdallarchaeaceae archaeon]